MRDADGAGGRQTKQIRSVRDSRRREVLGRVREDPIQTMITRLAHISLQVRDIQRAIAFYRDGLGFPVAFEFARKGALGGVYFAVGGQSFLEVFENDPPVGITHFCLETDDIDAFIAGATAKGIVCTPKALGDCGTWQTWLRDPDGNAFEIHQYTDASMQFCGGTCEITWQL